MQKEGAGDPITGDYPSHVSIILHIFIIFKREFSTCSSRKRRDCFSVAAYPSDCGVCSSVEMVQMIYFGALKNEDEHLAE